MSLGGKRRRSLILRSKAAASLIYLYTDVNHKCFDFQTFFQGPVGKAVDFK